MAVAPGPAGRPPPAHDGHGGHMSLMVATAPESFSAQSEPLAPTGWTATAGDASPGHPVGNVLDGDPGTMWHSRYEGTPAPLPHTVTIDMTAPRDVSGLRYLPRQDGTPNGRIGRFSVSTSLDGVAYTLVSTGTWADTAAEKAVAFPPHSARYVRLTAHTEAGGRGPWTSAAGIVVLRGQVAPPELPRVGWTATAGDASPGSPAANVLDGDAATMWHSRFEGTPAPLPHSITIDMQSVQDIAGLRCLPRQDGDRNGTIGRYSVTVSRDGATFSAPVATGTWADSALEKTVLFPAVSARYVRLTAGTEAGGRGPWSSAAEITVLGAVPPPVLPRAGWSASASDASAAHPAGNVLDGDPGSFWHSRFEGTPVPLPHTVTVDMTARRDVSGLRYLPRQDGTPNGNIGEYAVTVSTDGATFSAPVATGTFADSATMKPVRFPAVPARHVRLTALTEAGDRGPWSSAAELQVLGVDRRATYAGRWGPTISFPIVPVSAVVLPNSKLLTFSAYAPMAFDMTSTVTQVAVYDLVTGEVGPSAHIDVGHQMFCTGLTLLPDGRVLVNGGSSDAATTIYDPFADTWTRGPKMTIPRAYQGNTLLSDGRVFTIGGSWHDRAGSKHAEVWSPTGATGSWRRLADVPVDGILTDDPDGVYRADNHAWVFGVSNGDVFHAGPSRRMNWITTGGSGSIRSAGTRADAPDMMNGNAVMYDVGRILAVGGAPGYDDSAATSRAYTIDITGGPSAPVRTARVPDMAYPRSFINSVVLPDGSVVVLGGQAHAKAFTDTGAARAPELWDPATGGFSILAPEAVPRTYHSVAVLLPDGRVFSGGGGLCGTCTTNHPDGQVLTPPYLLDEDGSERARPVIVTAPASAGHGSTITVRTSGSTPRFSLVRTSAVTHSVNTDQRRVPLAASTTDGVTYTMRIPGDRGVVLPGYHLLFAMTADGTPSVARFIHIA
ncbi:discoidin domain-containing protein [Geodermatophilus sp. SYSU D01105]